MSSKVQAQTKAQCESDRVSAPSGLSPEKKQTSSTKDSGPSKPVPFQPDLASSQVPPEVPAIVREVLGSRGQSLEPGTRTFMEPRFGYDFSQVRVHTDTKAAESAREVNALAYTLGRNVVFGAGQYAPGTRNGGHLLAHELAHVVQQQNVPTAVQGKLKIGDPSDRADMEAEAAGHALMTQGGSPFMSSALQIRHRLRTSPPTHYTIQRAIKKSWGGEYKTDKYALTKDPGMDGVDIELKFKPNKHVNAELIGMTQTVRCVTKGSPIPFKMYGKDEEKARKSRAIPTGEVGEGTFIDRISSYGNPLYATDKPGAGHGLADTPTVAFWGRHGWRYTDKAGKLQKQDALLKDRPQMPSGLKESSQTFETTALAVKGVQEGTYYGSVQWGWEKNAAGKVRKLPLTLVSNDVPSSVFARASELWNKAKTSKGKETIDLPFAWGRYINTQGTWLVSNPSKYKTTIVGKIPKNTRLEVTDKGAKQRFNRTVDKYKWWKVTVVDGTHIGKVGWVMQTLLSDKKTK